MRLIALTGGIASGKTTVAKILARHGGVILDADQIARDVVEPGTPGLKAIVEAFGLEVLDSQGGLDRQALARRVFADEEARQRLNAIVHPAVKAALDQELERLGTSPSPPPFVVLVIPLLFEAGMQAMADSVWVVSVPPEIQKERLMQRDRLTEAEAEARMGAQWPLEKKVALANQVIDNTGTPEDLERQVEAALRAEGVLP